MKFRRTARLNWNRNYTIAAVSLFALLGVAFAIHLSQLFGQLDEAFRRENQFVPTRLFSDVIAVRPSLPRSLVEGRLKALGYSPRVLSASSIEFNLHPTDYPSELVPVDHPTLKLGGKRVRLTFAGPKAQDPVTEVAGLIGAEFAALPEIFLEPELIATLSKSDASEKREIRKIVRFEEIPASIWQAILAVEDPRYLEHGGLDPRGIARALVVNIRTMSLSQGGSTITAQLVKNLMARRSRNPFLKFNELFLSLILETRYSKEQILERYLNEVYLGQVGSYEVHGVSEGAALFFGKDMDELNLAEMALMAGLIRGPGYYSPYRFKDRAMERQRWVLKKMVDGGFIADEEAQMAAKQSIRLAPPITIANKAPYFTDYVKAEMIRQLKDRITEHDIAAAGFRVYTTLDPFLSEIAQRSVAEGVATLEKKLGLDGDTVPEERLEGALASVDQRTGYIRALVGGRNYARNTFNRILNMKRQVGSTFKPFVYLAALLKGYDENGVAYGGAYPVNDAPWTLKFDKGRQDWKPRNYDKDFNGWIPMRTALAKSVNTVAAKLGVAVGIPSVIETARALGIKTELPSVPSLSLGVAELSPVELLSAYATIAHHGMQDELTVIRSIQNPDGSNFARFVYSPRQVYPPGPTDLLTYFLQGTFTEGSAVSAARLGFTHPAAGKTGTTSNYRDSWFAGFTPDLTTVVWVGMDQNTSLVEKNLIDPATGKKRKRKSATITGSSGALPIWVDFMKNTVPAGEPKPFPISEYLEKVKINRFTGSPATLDCEDRNSVEDWYHRDALPRNSDCKDTWPSTVPLTSLDH